MISLLSLLVLAAEMWPSEKVGGSAAEFGDFETIFKNILGVVMALFGIIAFILLIAGGFKLAFSGGNPEAVKKAAGTITWAVVGLILLIAIWLILVFIKEFTGVDVTTFSFPAT